MGTYNDMNSGRFRHDLYQMVTAPDFGFYQMMPHNDLQDGSGKLLSEAEHGNFKFHLTIAPKDVAKAWDIVSDKLMNHTHAHIAKVTKPETSESFAKPESIQAGKHITIYTFESISPEIYKNLIQDIENDLAKAGIKPGPQSNADRIIPGGRYTGYRSDKDDDGEYIGSSDIKHLPREQRYNPYNQKDPYKNFSLRNNLLNKPSVSNKQDVLGQSNTEQSVGIAPWAMASKGEKPLAYLKTENMSPQEIESMKNDLNVLGIKNDDHKTGAFGGGKQEVIRVTGEDVAKIKHLQRGLPLNENMNQMTPQIHKDTAPVSAKSAFSVVTNGLSEKLQVGVGNAIKVTTQAMKNVFGGG